jgi:hypothetical protein
MCNSKSKITITHHRRVRNRIATPDAPTVDIALEGGLLPISALAHPVEVSLIVWDDARLEDTYQLMFNGNTVGPALPILPNHKPGDLLSLEIMVEALTEGQHQVAYQLRNPSNGVRQDSKAFLLEVDLTAPGAPELGAIAFPQIALDGLTLAELEGLGGYLEGDIASYSGMALGDRVQTYWGKVKGSYADVDGDDMGLKKVNVLFSKEFLTELGEIEEAVTYTVTDRAGNESISSNPIAFKLNLNEIPANLPAPEIDPAVGNLVNYAEARAGVAIDIPRYLGATALDKITLSFGENNPLPEVQLEPGDELEDPVLTIRVPFDIIARAADGVVNISYQVHRQTQPVGTSLIKVVELLLALPGPDEPDALTIQGTSITNPNTLDNFIDEDDFELNANAILQWKSGFVYKDVLNLHWGQQISEIWYEISEEDVFLGLNLNVPILNTVMAAQGAGKDISVYYTVTREGNPNATASAIQSVVVRAKSELPGGDDGLSAPEFTNLTESGLIGPVENPNGAPVFIRPYINIQKDQKITFTFSGFDTSGDQIESANYTAERELDNNNVINGYTFLIPAVQLKAICTGHAEAYFRVDPVDGANHSPATSVKVSAPVDMHLPTGDCRDL